MKLKKILNLKNRINSYYLILNVLKKKKRFLIPILIFSILSSIFSGLSIGLIIPLLEGNDRNIFSDTYFKFLDDFLQFGFGTSFQDKIIQISFLIMILSLFEFLFTSLIIKLSVKVQYIIETEFLNKIFEKISRMKYSKFFSYKDGEIFTVITTDIYNVSNVVIRLLLSIQSFILIFIYFTIMFSVSPWLTFISIIFFVFISIIVAGLIGRKTKIINTKVAELFLKINSDLSYFIENYKKVIGLGVEDKFSKDLKNSYKEFINERTKYSKFVSYTLPLNNLVNTLSIAALLLAGSFLFANQSNTWTVMLIPFLVLLFKILPMVASLNGLRVAIESNKPFIERLENFISENNDSEEKNKSNYQFANCIEFDDVSFNFENKIVLEKATLSIEKDKITSIVGPSGVGKTTVIDLILKIFTPDSGDIFIDGINIDKISTNSLRESISFLPQDLLMVNSSIINNVNLFKKNVSPETIISNIDKLNFSSESSKLIMDKNIGLGGINLSGGQKQKINIIRTILKDSQFIIFDEPTNNLDSHSIKLFVDEIKNIKNKKTILFVTHEEALIQISDNVFELNQNTIKKHN